MGKVHVGTVGDIVIPALENAEYSIDVCSPWISTDYARLLRSKASQGVKVRLITSQDQQALGVFEKHRPPRQSSGTLLSDLFSEPSGQFVVKLGVVTAFLMLLVGIMDQSWTLALIGGASLLLAGYLSLKEHPHLSASSDVEHPLPMTLMTVPSGKFHAKMYIVDQSVAYVGSANLTRASMYGKRERIEVKSLSDEVREEERAFSDLWEMED